MENAAKDPVGVGAEGKREVEEPVEDPGSTGRWEVWAGGAGFPFFTDVGKLVPTEEDAGSDVSEWELWERREREAEMRADAEALDAEE